MEQVNARSNDGLVELAGLRRVAWSRIRGHRYQKHRLQVSPLKIPHRNESSPLMGRWCGRIGHPVVLFSVAC